MSNSGLAATLRDGASNWTAILASLTTASNCGFVRDFAVVWLYLGTILWYGCITSSHFSWGPVLEVRVCVLPRRLRGSRLFYEATPLI